MIPAADIESLPLPELALRLLADVRGGNQISVRSILMGMRPQSHMFGGAAQTYTQAQQERIADAWAWLESHALLAPSVVDPPTGKAQRVSELGEQLLRDPAATSRVWAQERLSGDLAAELASARANFDRGDYETAAFAAMKAVEVAVREASGLANDQLGVPLMRAAFNPSKNGPLCDHEAEGGEQQAIADLFAGAIGAYKNPASHRTVHYDDPMEAAEVIQLADLLLRIVKRARARTDTP